MTVAVVHGNFLGPWSWDNVASGLSARGIRTIVVDLPSGDPAAQPGGDLYADARAVREAMLSADGPYVLCGHSYGGVVITEAAAGAEDVTHLVYLAGAAPDAGDSPSYLHVSVDDAEQAGAQQDADGEHKAVRVRDDGMNELTWDSAAAALFHDFDAARVEQALEQLRPSNPTVGSQPITTAAWRDIPATYVRCTQDRVPDCSPPTESIKPG